MRFEISITCISLLCLTQVFESIAKLDINCQVDEEVGQVVDEEEVVDEAGQGRAGCYSVERACERRCVGTEDAETNLESSGVRTQATAAIKYENTKLQTRFF